MQDGPKRILIFVTVVAGVIGFLTYGHGTVGALLNGVIYAVAAYAVGRGLLWVRQGFVKR
jgi:hypothetical protein